MPGPQNMTNLHRAIEAWNRGLLDDYLDLYDESVRLYGYSPEPMDKPAVRDFYAMMFKAFPGSRWTIDEEVVDGDRATVRFTLIGKHKGEFMGIPATGRDIAMAGQTMFHFRRGRVVERWCASDMLGLLVQLGAVSASWAGNG